MENAKNYKQQNDNFLAQESTQKNNKETNSTLS